METLEHSAAVSPQIVIVRELETQVSKAGSILGPLYLAATVLSAFLLFQIQLIIAKYLLPWFGGGPAVWTTCMVFFEVLLVAGYLYSHVLTTKFGLRRQSYIHTTLVFVSFCAMAFLASRWRTPVMPPASWKPTGIGSPAWQLTILLCASVGFPFVVLSSTGPLLQRWFSGNMTRNSPYRLYSFSNIGSLLALVTYPFFFERLLDINQQAWLWTALYVVFLIAVASVGLLRLGGEVAPLDSSQRNLSEALDQRRPALKWRQVLEWVALAACGSAMLLATTNLMCQEVAVVPLLWVLPLALYLFSFVICFDRDQWCKRGLFQLAFLLTSLLALRFAVWGSAISIVWQVGCLSAALFSLCLVCHGELASLKPRAPSLTSFYLAIGIGGAIGGLFVAVVAPFIFRTFAEFYFCLLGCSIVSLVSLIRDKASWIHRSRTWVPWVLLLFAALLPGSGLLVPTSLWLLVPYNVIYRAGTCILALLVLTSLVRARNQRVHANWVVASLASVVLLVTYACYSHFHYGADETLRLRNFFGVKELQRGGDRLKLINGRIIHGWQFLERSRRDEPTAYYDRESGIGRLLQERSLFRTPHLRVGVIGLGAGTLAAYGSRGDFIRFYEIDPAVIQMSSGPDANFTFIADSAATVTIVPGDARLSLQREADRGQLQQFDILAVDAFSSDAIPVHLVTREALTLYLRHLRNRNSVIAFHISNNCVDLKPVLSALSADEDLSSIVATGKGSEWILLSKNAQMLQSAVLAPISSPLETKKAFLWTDDFSNLTQVLR